MQPTVFRKEVIKIVSHAIMVENFKTNSELMEYIVNNICNLAELLIDKQSVELVAEGEVKEMNLLPGVIGYTIGDKDDLKIFYEILAHQGKEIKLYIEVPK